MTKTRLYPVGCDGGCGTVLFVEATRRPPQGQSFYCSEECQRWAEGRCPVCGSVQTDAGLCPVCSPAVARMAAGR